MNEYEKQAKDFMEKTGTRALVLYVGKESPTWDKKKLHDTYDIRFIRGNVIKTFRFTDSVYNTVKNKIFSNSQKEELFNIYDVLATLTKNPYDTFDDFCDCMGYSNDNIAANNIYKAVKVEYVKVVELWEDFIDELREIY